MLTLSRPRSRRFVPALDGLPSRLTPSGVAAVVSPMDPVMLGPDEPPPPPVVVSPMDPVMLGPDTPPATDIVINSPSPVAVDPTAAGAPAWADSAGCMGDMLVTSAGTAMTTVPTLTCP